MTSLARPWRRVSRPVDLGRNAAILIVAAVLVLWSLVPIVWLAVMATQPEVSYTGAPLAVSAETFSLRWIEAVLADPSFVSSATNSIVIATSVMVVSVLLGTLAAYPLARMQVPGRRLFLGIVVASRIVPSMILLVPMFLVARTLGLLNTHLIMIAVYSALLLPFATWLLRNFLEQIPLDLERAARMDGCTRVSALFRIIMPLALPGVATTAIFCFIDAWNAFLFALVLTGEETQPITRFLAERNNSANFAFQATVSDLAAAGVLAVVPVIVMVAVLNRQIVRGVAPSIKG